MDKDIRKVKVESEGHESIQAVANLRRLESGGYPDQISLVKDNEDVHKMDSDFDKMSASVPGKPRSNPKRDAAVQAQQKWLSQFLLTKH